MPKMFYGRHDAIGNKNGLKPRRAPVFEDVDGKPCVWISTAKGNKHLIDMEDFVKVKDIPWHDHNGYACFRSGRNAIFLHQLICRTEDGHLPDHKDGNRWDSRRSNLRPATKAQNGWNAKPSSRNSSGVKGVKLHRSGKFQAEIYCNGIYRYLGLFGTLELATEARRKAEIELFGEFRRVA